MSSAAKVHRDLASAAGWWRAALAGASDKVPTDRPVDSIGASSFRPMQLPLFGRISPRILRTVRKAS